MSRQKQVFDRDTVAHLWAHRAQDSARDASGNFYFRGQALYSYGSHFCIAYILGDECGPDLAGRVLWNDSTYSNTTSKMQSIAWRALTNQQKNNALFVPSALGLGRNTDPQNIERALAAKKLPDVMPAVIGVVVESVSELNGKRYGGGPFENLLHKARKAEALAQAFYKRAGRKYPLHLIDSRPTSSDKNEWAAWIRSIALTSLKQQYRDTLAEIKNYAAQSEENASGCTMGFPYFKHAPGCEWEARNIVSGTYDIAERVLSAIDKARSIYKLINDKAGPVSLNKTAIRMRELADVFKARRDEFTIKETQNRIIWAIRESIKTMRRHTRNKLPLNVCVYSDMETLHRRAKESGLYDSLYLSLAERYSRIGAAYAARNAIERAVSDVDTAQSYMPQWPGDALRHARQALERIKFVDSLPIADKMREHIRDKVESIREAANVLTESARAAIIEKNAETLRAWLACESNVRPSYEAETFARINGANVETTRGASVPVAHACRLSRMYSIVVKRGGQEWRDGEGPMVGHYRVNKIGADGSLIIGCHEFSANEAQRLHGVLSACAECEGVE